MKTQYVTHDGAIFENKIDAANHEKLYKSCAELAEYICDDFQFNLDDLTQAFLEASKDKNFTFSIDK